MNTEERQLAEMLRRVTPEPPRRVTVDDVASRLASQDGYREPRPRRGFSGWGFSGASSSGWSRGWAPALAAASVLIVAGTSAGIATVVTSHHSPVTSPGGGTPASSASVSSAPSSTAPSASPPGSAGAPLRIAGGLWGAELISRGSYAQDSLTGGGQWLFALTDRLLIRIDPATGQTASVALPGGPLPGPPVVVGNTVWVASPDGNGVLLRGFGVRSLAPVGSVSVPAIGRVSSSASGVLAAGPDGRLYLAAGDTVAIVDPASGDRDPADLPGRGPGQLGGGLTGREQAVRGDDTSRLLPVAGLRHRHPTGARVVHAWRPAGSGTWSRPRAASGARTGAG